MSVYTDNISLQHVLSQQKPSSHQWQHLDKLQHTNCSYQYWPVAVNWGADALSRIYHPVSATQAATITIYSMELQIIGAEEAKQEVSELLVDDAYFGPIVKVLHNYAKSTEGVGHWALQSSKDSIIGKICCKQDSSHSIMAFCFAEMMAHSASC
jgi:hypothetical protein